MLPILQWAAPGARIPDTTAPADAAPGLAESPLDFAALLRGDWLPAAAAGGEALPRGGNGLPLAAADAGARAGTTRPALATADPLVALAAAPPPVAGQAGSAMDRAAIPAMPPASSGPPGAAVPGATVSPDAAGAAMRAPASREVATAVELPTASTATARPLAPPPLPPAVAQRPSPDRAGIPEPRAAAVSGVTIPAAAPPSGSDGAAPPPATPAVPAVPRGDAADAIVRAFAQGGEQTASASGDVAEHKVLPQTAAPAPTSHGTSPTPAPAGGGAATAGALPAGAGIATPPGAPGWNEALGDRILWMAGSRIGNADIQLHPAEMGPLRIQVSVEDGATSVTFQAQNPVTREAIEQALPRLREALSEQGLSLGQATVTGQGSQQERPGAGGAPAGAALADAGEDQAVEVTEPSAAISSHPARTAIDLFA